MHIKNIKYALYMCMHARVHVIKKELFALVFALALFKCSLKHACLYVLYKSM